MNTKQAINSNVRQLEAQVTELGTATKLTLGFNGSGAESNRRYFSWW